MKFYDTFEKTDWGMTQEECKQVMKLNDESLLPLEEEMFHGFKTSMNVYGEQADVDFLFVRQIGELKQELGLGMVFVKIDDCDAIEVYKKLCKQLEVESAEMGEEKVDFNQTFVSEYNFLNYEEGALLKKAQDFYLKAYSDDIIIREENYFSQVRFATKNEARTVEITFDGVQGSLLNYLK